MEHDSAPNLPMQSQALIEHVHATGQWDILVRGGVHYLAQGNLSLVYHALREPGMLVPTLGHDDFWQKTQVQEYRELAHGYLRV